MLILRPTGAQADATAVGQESDTNSADAPSSSGAGTSHLEAPPSGLTTDHVGESSASTDAAVAIAPTANSGPLSPSGVASAVASAVAATPNVPQGSVIAIPNLPHPTPPFGPGALVDAADINFTPAEVDYVPADLLP